MTSDAATWGEIMPGNACALNEKVEAARAHTKIEAVLVMSHFLSCAPGNGQFSLSVLSKEPDVFVGLYPFKSLSSLSAPFWLLRNWLPIRAVPNKTASNCDMTTGRNGLARTGPNLSRRLAKETPRKSLTKTGHKGVNNCDALRIVGGAPNIRSSVDVPFGSKTEVELTEADFRFPPPRRHPAVWLSFSLSACQ
jgi:hypothetical protein